MTQPAPFPTLETPRLLLRRLTLDDAEAVFRNFSDKEVARWFLDQPYDDLRQAEQIIEEFQKDYEQGTGIPWAIVLKDGGKVIGTCSYERYELGGCGEIGYDLARDHWGHGLMAEALRAVVAYGFEALRLERIEATTQSDNARSIALLERLGFEQESVQGDSIRFSLCASSGGGGGPWKEQESD